MDLREVTTLEQLQDYYNEKGLLDVEAKINHLMDVTKIKAVRCEHGSLPERELVFLEDCVVIGGWKGYL